MLTQEEDMEIAALRGRGWTVSAIARHTGRDRKTVKVYLKGEAKRRRRRAPSVLEPYRDYLVRRIAHGQRGSADLCSYFFLRAAGLLRKGGILGYLATNTIAQGDSREVGLDHVPGRMAFSVADHPRRPALASAQDVRGAVRLSLDTGDVSALPLRRRCPQTGMACG